MFKQLIAFILLLSFSLGTFNKAFIVLDYFSDISAYKKKCENKAKPSMGCNGKCQMLKKLKKEEKKDEQNPERRVEKKDEVFVSSKLLNITTRVFPTLILETLYPKNICGKEIKMPRFILRPPIS